MSYDMDLVRKPGATTTHQEIVEYFRTRPRYELEPGVAHYRNYATRVAFRFYLAEPGGDAEFEGAQGRMAWFNINYGRSAEHVAEAACELSAITKRFDLLVRDSQDGRATPTRFDEQSFMRSWTSLNGTIERLMEKLGDAQVEAD